MGNDVTYDQAWAAKALGIDESTILAFAAHDDGTFGVVTFGGQKFTLTADGRSEQLSGPGSEASVQHAVAFEQPPPSPEADLDPAPETPADVDEPKDDDGADVPPLDEDEAPADETTDEGDDTPDYFKVAEDVGGGSWTFKRIAGGNNEPVGQAQTYKYKKDAVKEAKREAKAEGLEVRIA